MKAVSISDAQGQLKDLIAQACQGELIVLTDGEKQVSLEPRVGLDLDEDSPELEAELLKAVNGPHSLFSESELREISTKALAEHQSRRQK